MKLNESILRNLKETVEETRFNGLEDIKKLKDFTYTCYYCGKEVTEEVDKLLNTLKSYGYSDEDILQFFNEPMYNLCNDCAKEEE